jgi:hypothetical protein
MKNVPFEFFFYSRNVASGHHFHPGNADRNIPKQDLITALSLFVFGPSMWSSVI